MSDYRLNTEEVYSLAERIHEIAVEFKKLRDSSFWSVDTFRISDVVSYLDRRQAVWLLANLGSRFGIETDDEVEKLEIDFPPDVAAGAGQMYVLLEKLDPLIVEDNGIGQPVKIIVRKLHFVVFDRRKAEAAQ